MTATIEQIGTRALSSASTVQASYDIARLAIARGVSGDFVECGVFAGVQSACMAKVLMDFGIAARGRKVHLFDSFAGIPKCGPEDLEFVAHGHKAGLSACSIENVRSFMDEWGIDPSLLVYHHGLFADTVSAARIESIAVLRLDGDLYESTKVCMEHLYPKLSAGGWCIVDDWNLSGCRKAIAETVGYEAPIYWRKS